jgi:hypothetical protein
MPLEVLTKDLFNMNDYRVFATLLSLKEKEVKEKNSIKVGDDFFDVLSKPSDEGVVPYKGMTRDEVIVSLNRMTQDIKLGAGQRQINYKIINKVEDLNGKGVIIHLSSKFLKEFRSPTYTRL